MDIDELMQTALMKHRDGDFDAARAIYEQILEDDPDHTAANLNLASVHLDGSDTQEAADLLQHVLALDEDNGVAHLLYSRACFLTGNHDEGYAHVAAAFELIPEEEGVAAEFVSAMRRRYFTFSQDDYTKMFEAAQRGELDVMQRQRLAHLTFLRISRPELIKLVVQPALPEDTPDALTRWMQDLPEGAQQELAVLARNFGQAVVLMYQTPEFQPQPATLHLRKLPDEQGPDTQAVNALEDCDTLTGATLELVTGRGIFFVPFSQIKSIEFAEPAAVVGAFVTLKDGNVLSGMMPLFYLFTEFAESDKVRQGQSTLIRPVLADIAVGVGMRALRADGKPIPIVRVEKIEFHG
jgi:hypothetical protein